MIEALVGAVAGAGLTAVGFGMFHPRFALFGPQHSHGPRTGSRVALSFDDGPHPEFTPRIAEALAKAKARATFFCIGELVERSPEVARALIAAGHELGNHTFSHNTAGHLFSAAALTADLQRCQTLLSTFGPPPRWYRPAVGIRNPPVHAAARAVGVEVVMWSGAARDGAWAFDEAKALKLGREATAGDILVLHDGLRGTPADVREATVRNLPVLLSELQRRGLEAVTVTELLGAVSL